MTWQFPFMPSAPAVDVLPDYNNDIEEEMTRAAIEASKRELENVSPDQQFGALNDIPGTQYGQSRLDDADIEHAVSLSLKTAEQKKALRNLQETAGVSDLQAYTPMEVGDRGKRASNGRLDVGSSSLHDEVEDVEEQPLVRNRSRHMSSASIDTADEIGGAEDGLPSSPGQPTSGNHLPQSTNDVHNDEWGGMSSLEHDEAVMLEAALFGGIPEGRGYQFPYAPHQLMQNGLDRSSNLYSQRMPRSPSPGLVTQRLLREQQDDEYLASLQADREKAEARCMEEAAAREAALEEERKKEEESRKKLEEEQEANEESKSVTKASAMKGIKKKMEKDVDEVGKIARNVKAKIEAIRRENLAHRQKPGCGKGTAIDRSRTNMTKQRIQDEYRKVVERRVITMTGTRPDEETIENLIETGNSEQIFQNAMQEMGRGQVSINN